jgi:hypothetical protein
MQATFDHFFPSKTQREQEYRNSNSSGGGSSSNNNSRSSSSSNSTRTTAPPPSDPFVTLGLAKVRSHLAFFLAAILTIESAGILLQLLPWRSSRRHK